MNHTENRREYIQDEERLYSLLALLVIIAIGLGDLLFAMSLIVPQWRVRKTLTSQLASAEKNLEAEKAQAETSEKLRQQVATAQAILNEAATIFLSESQAAEALNKLPQYASESGVEIIGLQPQPSPTEAKKDIYDVRVFRLQAEGTLPKLMDFISRIKEAAFKGFIIANVNITGGEGLRILTMDITLYTSPYSSGAVVPATPPANLAQLNEALSVAVAAREWAQVISLINQILAIDPDYDDMVEKLYAAHVNYGYQLLGEGDTGGATMQFNAALKIKPGGVEAMAGLQQAAATPPPTLTVAEQLERRLDEAWAAQNWKEAISLIEQILAINPDDEDMTAKLYTAHVNYGRKLAAERRLEEAKEEFTRALAIKPEGAEALAGLRELADKTLPSTPTLTATPSPTPSPTPTSQPQTIIYVVRQGDTLYSIARRYGTTVQAIMAANGLTNDNIYVGQQLYIPTQ